MKNVNWLFIRTLGTRVRRGGPPAIHYAIRHITYDIRHTIYDYEDKALISGCVYCDVPRFPLWGILRWEIPHVSGEFWLWDFSCIALAFGGIYLLCLIPFRALQ